MVSVASAAVIAIKIAPFICTSRINLLSLKPNSVRLAIIAKGFLKLPN